MGIYLARIMDRFKKQEQKGIAKYGQILEDNPAQIKERLEHLAQELTDGLMYVEWIKEGIMAFDQYQRLAERTANRGPDDTTERRFINFAFGLMGETGEIVDYLKKILFHGHDLDANRDKLKLELGDCLWYIAMIASAAGLSLNEVAIANIEKLRKRYPDGFSEEQSRNRPEMQDIPARLKGEGTP